ncbi:MAG: hypothetical protein JW776_06090 [Candidatus Lokiarchaeota archaeon]|nr:hypothetical protein [Candidatus Lokiarchaeota archaeon]
MSLEDFTEVIEKLLEKVDEITLNDVEITSEQLELLVGDPNLIKSLIKKSTKEK